MTRKAANEKIETGVPYTKVRSAYARKLLDMKPGESIKVLTPQRFNAYRMAAQRYGVAIVTRKLRLWWRIWKQGDTQDVAAQLDFGVRKQNCPTLVVATHRRGKKA